jgi:hypothetical protein
MGNDRLDGRAPGEPVSRKWFEALPAVDKQHPGLLALIARLGLS